MRKKSAQLKKLGFIASVVLLTPQVMIAQTEAEEAIECFVEATRTWKVTCDPSPAVSVGEVMLHPDNYPSELVGEIVRGLKELAVSSPISQVRIAAVGWLALKGEVFEAHSGSTVKELEEIYFSTPFGDVRRGIASKIRLQLAKNDAVSFLERAAEAPATSDEAGIDLPSPRIALHSLASMGELGRATLRRLSIMGTVTDPVAKRYLKNLADVNFRLPKE